MTIPWNELAIWWNEVSQGWNKMVWNEMVIERNDRNSCFQAPVRNLVLGVFHWSGSYLSNPFVLLV